MNDFGVSIHTFVGVVKPRSFGLGPKATLTDRKFKIESGPGCEPTLGTLRKVKGHWLSDMMPDSLSSYDFEYVLDTHGVKLERLPEEVLDVQPVKLASECATPPALVRRKKGR